MTAYLDMNAKRGVAKFFRNADAPTWKCVVAIIGGMIVTSVTYFVLMMAGLDTIYKNGLPKGGVFWIAAGVNLFCNLSAYAGLTCLISKINPKRTSRSFVRVVVAVLSCIILLAVYLPVRVTMSGHAIRSVWECLVFVELCRGLWRWIAGVRKEEQTGGSAVKGSSCLQHKTSKLMWIIIGALVVVFGIVYCGSCTKGPAKPLRVECRKPVLGNVTREKVKPKPVENVEETLSFAELTNRMVWSSQEFDIPVEMRSREQQANFAKETRNLDKFWGVQLGSVVEQEGGILAYKSYSTKCRYWFTPRCRPAELRSFFVSTTPKTHKVWRVRCSTEGLTCLSLEEALCEIDRLRGLFACFNYGGEEYNEADGSWTVFSANTNRIIDIYCERHPRGFAVYAEAVDCELAAQMESERKGDTIQGLFGIDLGATIKDYPLEKCEVGRYAFKPLKQFHNFTKYEVLTSLRSGTIYCIEASHRYQDGKDADYALSEVLSILRYKFPKVSVKEQEQDGYRKSIVLQFETGMEEERYMLLRVDEGNTLYLSAVANDGYCGVKSREEFQAEVIRLKQAADAL